MMVGNKKFLENFPVENRSWVTKWFMDAIRSGLTKHEDIIRSVLDAIEKSLADRYITQYEGKVTVLNLARGLINAFSAEVNDFIDFYLTWEAQDRDQKQAVKSANAKGYILNSMVGKPVTAAQIAYLASLGWRGPQPADRAEASELLDRLARK